jgi:hypothetical protein
MHSRIDRYTLVLWVCIVLFFVRVIGQIEALLLEPIWLPDMWAWYSGLLPYPLLLPLQIALLMLMCALVIRRQATGSSWAISRQRRVTVWRSLALIYFLVMVVRLVICIYRHGPDFYLHGGIPIAFHWVLALFVFACTRPVTFPDERARHGTPRVCRDLLT